MDDTYHIYSGMLLAVMIVVVLFGIRVLRANTHILKRIDDREKRVQDDLAERAMALEQKTALIAQEIALATEQREADAVVRHNRMIEASLQAAEASRVAAIQAAETKDDVHKLVLSQSPAVDETLLAISEDTNTAVHEIKRHVVDDTKDEKPS